MMVTECMQDLGQKRPRPPVPDVAIVTAGRLVMPPWRAESLPVFRLAPWTAPGRRHIGLCAEPFPPCCGYLKTLWRTVPCRDIARRTDRGALAYQP
jgi:hypothetical protein